MPARRAAGYGCFVDAVTAEIELELAAPTPNPAAVVAHGELLSSALLTEVLADHPAVGDVVQYRIGPSVGAHTGPGTAGLFVF